MFSFKHFIEEKNKKLNKKFDVKFFDLYENKAKAKRDKFSNKNEKQ
jgi:hypothetical protein